MRKIVLLLLTLVSIGANALVPIVEPTLSKNPTGIAPAYFGPNALPVPDMQDGRVESNLRVELAGDGYWGYEGDRTADVFARVCVPLFTRWANLTIWMPLQEWYRMTPERQRTCRLQDTTIIAGHGAGDAYVTTNIQLLSGDFPCFAGRDRRYWYPDISLRAAIKSASGGQFGLARHFDNPGYWFDVAIGENLLPATCPVALRLSGTAGFLCWQTDNGRQNDAVLYGLKLALRQQYVSLSAAWQGYVGWENYGDRPMVVKVTLAGHVGQFEPFVNYQYGIRDYPFHMLRVGFAYNFNILRL